MKNPSSWLNPAIVLGGTLYILDQSLNINYMLENKSKIDLLLAVPLAGLAATACAPYIRTCWQNKQYDYVIGLIIMFKCFAVFSLGASLDRVASDLDSKVQNTKSRNLPAQLAMKAYNKAEKTFEEAEQAKIQECATGFGTKCRSRIKLLEQAKKAFQEAESKVKAFGSVQQHKSAMAARIAKMTSLNEDIVLMYFPFALPFGIWLGSIVFIGIGLTRYPETIVKTETKKPQKKVRQEIPRHVQIHNWICQQKTLGNTPTQKQIAKHFNISTSTVSRDLKKPRLAVVQTK